MIFIRFKTNIFKKDTIDVTTDFTVAKSVYKYIVDNVGCISEVLRKYPEVAKSSTLKVSIDGVVIPGDDLDSVCPKRNDLIVVEIVPKFQAAMFPVAWGLVANVAAFVLNSALAYGLSWVAMQLMAQDKVVAPVPDDSGVPDSATYTWDGPSTSYAMLRPIPMVYGQCTVGGCVIGAVVEGVNDAYGLRLHDFPPNRNANVTWSNGYFRATDELCRKSFECGGLPLAGGCNYNIYFLSTLRYYDSTTSQWVIDKLDANEVIFNLHYPWNEGTGYWEAYWSSWGGQVWSAPYGYCVIYRRIVDEDGNTLEDWTQIYTQSSATAQQEDENKDRTRKDTCSEYYDDTTKCYYEYVVSRYNDGMNNNVNQRDLGHPEIKTQYYGQGKIDDVSIVKESDSSTNALTLLLGISDGEISGMEHGSVTLNDVPLQDLYLTVPPEESNAAAYAIQADLGENYPITEEYDPGTCLINLFTKTELNKRKLKVELLANVAASEYETLSSNVEGLEIGISFPGGFYSLNKDTGDKNDNHSVLFRISYELIDDNPGTHIMYFGSTEDPTDAGKKVFEFTDFRKEAFTITLSIGTDTLPLPSGQYRISIERLTEVNPDDYTYDRSYIVSLTEFQYNTLYYPNTAVLALRMIANERLSGGAPDINIDVTGRYVKCPVLRDSDGYVVPVQMAYTELVDEDYVWYGTNGASGETEELELDSTNTMYQYTNNGALITYDLLTNTNLHPYISEDNLTWSEFLFAAAYCWEHVQKHGHITAENAKDYEHRHECDIVIDAETEAANLILQLTSSFRSKLYWFNNKLTLTVLRAETYSQVFTEDLIVENTYRESYITDSKIPNFLEITYYDRDDHFKQDTIQVTVKDINPQKTEIFKQSFTLLSTTRKTEVVREANYLMKRAQSTDKIISFTAKSAATFSVPGSVIRVTQNTVPYGFGGYLRANSDTTTFTHYLNKTITIESVDTTTYKLMIQSMETGNIYSSGDYEIELTEGSYDSVVFEIAGYDPKQNDTWQLIPYQSATLYSKDLRVIAMERSQEDDRHVAITCEPYDASIYDDTVMEYSNNPFIPPVAKKFYPPDVVQLSAITVAGSNDVLVTYRFTDGSVPIFEADVATVDTDIRFITYTQDSMDGGDSQFSGEYSIQIYDGETGVFKGIVRVLNINKTNDNFYYTPNSSFTGVIEVGDKIVQVVSDNYLAVSHVVMYKSSDGSLYELLGSDHSKGKGFTVNNLTVGHTYYIKAVAIAENGQASRNPPVVTVTVGSVDCLPSPTHLSLCDKGDGEIYFTGCDACISWTGNMSLKGAGKGLEAEAGSYVSEKETVDYNFKGYYVDVYDNSGASLKYLRRINKAIGEETYTYTHEDNVKDQKALGFNNQGTRSLKFDVVQYDDNGNTSCDPATMSVSNLPPSMYGYPSSATRTGVFAANIDWASYETTTLFEQDILGYKVYYRNSVSNPWNVKDVGKATSVNISFPSSDIWYIKVLPYDCFGPGDLTTYGSTQIEVYILDTAPQAYVPEKPQGMVSGATIDSVSLTGYPTYYEITTSTNLSSYGFPNEDYTNDRIYYNCKRIGTYCSVTASDVNINNRIISITDNENGTYTVRFQCPDEDDLGDYTVEDSEPKEGQTFNINIFADYYYGSTWRWFTGLTSRLKYRFHVPDLNAQVKNAVEGYKLSVNTTFPTQTLGPTSFSYDPTKVVGEYYDGEITVTNDLGGTEYSLKTFSGLPANDESMVFSANLVLTSKAGQTSEALHLSEIYVVKENVDLPALTPVEITAHTDDNGQNLQIVVENWEEYFEDPTVEKFEVYAVLGWFCFKDGTGVPTSYPTVTRNSLPVSSEFYYKQYLGTDPNDLCSDSASDCYSADDDRDTPELGHTCWQYSNHFKDINTFSGSLLEYMEETLTETDYPEADFDRTRLVTKMDSSDYSDPDEVTTMYCHIGSFVGPVFHWQNTATGDRVFCECLVDRTLPCDCENGECEEGTEVCPDPDPGEGETDVSTRTRVTYNNYFIALAVRRADKTLEWVMDGDSVKIIQSENDLIDSMYIKNLAVTTAKIADLAVTNAKVLNVYADKIFVGMDDETALHCVWDIGGQCDHPTVDHTCFGTGSCPHGVVGSVECGCYIDGDTTYGYSPAEFGLSYLFDTSASGLPDPASQYTYINGGFIQTHTIKANSIQVGALPYSFDMDIVQTYIPTTYNSQTLVEDDYVQISYGSSKDPTDPDIDVTITFANGEQFTLEPGTWTFLAAGFTGLPDTNFTESALPSIALGTEKTRKFCAYINYLYLVTNGLSVATLYMDEIDSEETDDLEKIDQMRNNGKLPLFLVTILKDQPQSDEEATETNVLSGEISATSADFRVGIQFLAANGGTFISGNDITTGIIHNNTRTSVLDLREYGGLIEDQLYKSHGRLVIDGPSQLYPWSTRLTGVGDTLGSEWWNYFPTEHDQDGDQYFKCDTKLLIGRPYADGLEVMYPGYDRDEIEARSDTGYLWFYRTYESGANVGHLEIGGKLRVKDSVNDRDLLVGEEYAWEDDRWKRKSNVSGTKPGVAYYEIGRPWEAPGYEVGGDYANGPRLLCKLSEKLEMYDWGAGRALFSGRTVTAVADVFQDVRDPSNITDDMGFGLFDISTPATPKCLLKLGGDTPIKGAEYLGTPKSVSHFMSNVNDSEITLMVLFGQDIPLDTSGCYFYSINNSAATEVVVSPPETDHTSVGLAILSGSMDYTLGDPPSSSLYALAGGYIETLSLNGLYVTNKATYGSAISGIYTSPVNYNSNAYGVNTYPYSSNGLAVSLYLNGYSDSEAYDINYFSALFAQRYTEATVASATDGTVGALIATDENLYYHASTTSFGNEWWALCGVRWVEEVVNTLGYNGAATHALEYSLGDAGVNYQFILDYLDGGAIKPVWGASSVTVTLAGNAAKYKIIRLETPE